MLIPPFCSKVISASIKNEEIPGVEFCSSLHHSWWNLIFEWNLIWGEEGRVIVTSYRQRCSCQSNRQRTICHELVRSQQQSSFPCFTEQNLLVFFFSVKIGLTGMAKDFQWNLQCFFRTFGERKAGNHWCSHCYHARSEDHWVTWSNDSIHITLLGSDFPMTTCLAQLSSNSHCQCNFKTI